MKSKPKKKKNRSDPFILHVVGSGEEIKQRSGGRQAVVKAEQISRRWMQFSSLGDFTLSLSSFDENQMVWLCFDGIEGKKLADEVVREKRERKKENKKRKKKKESFVECFGVWRKW